MPRKLKWLANYCGGGLRVGFDTRLSDKDLSLKTRVVTHSGTIDIGCCVHP